MFKTIVTVLLIFCVVVFSAPNVGFVHPLDFKDTKAERQKVIDYIEKNVKETYANIGMDNPTILRMMEKEELDSFKKLTKVKNRKLLDRVIKTYCDIGMCNYIMILMMYNEELRASKESLSW